MSKELPGMMLNSVVARPGHRKGASMSANRVQRLIRVWSFARATRVGQTLCLMLCLCLPMAAQTSPPSPARQEFNQWLAAFDGGDLGAYRAFLEKNFPAGAGRADRDWQVRNNTGGFDLKKVVEETPTTITVMLQQRDSDMFGGVSLEVNAAEPHQIVKMEMRPVG
ncbi:MAG TPA: hypothetical protein VE178_16190, partial [Silvibacterium sp.]|nr:hypothetical protein [Silvibacterium sp.]